MCRLAPLFSILVPVYNARDHLEECLSSIEAQSCSDYEVVLVDDGSTDGSGELCDEFLQSYGGVKVVHQENGGLLLARRAALKQASGDYVVHLDADDALRCDALELIAGVVAEQAPDIVVFRFSRLNSFEAYPASGLRIAPGYYAGGQYAVYQQAVCDGRVISMWTKCYRRSVAGLSDDYSRYRGLTYAEDLIQSVRLAEEAKNFYYLDEALYYYRPNSKACTADYRSEYLDGLVIGVLIQSVRLAEEAKNFYYLDEALYYYRPNSKACTADYRSEYLDGLVIGVSAQIDYAIGLTSESLRLAKASALRQVMGLVHILLDSMKANEDAISELEAIRKQAELLGLFGSRDVGLGLGDRLAASALEDGHYDLLLLEWKLIGTVKTMFGR